MNTKNKILKVLEKVPSGTKLYSTAFGNLELESIVEAFGDKRIKLMEENRDRRIYLPDGRYKKGGEVTLYPSREIRDWDKFAWKKGDVLTNNKGAFCIFKEFSGYPYTNFVAIFVHIAGVSTSDSAVEITQEWHKASGENAGKYIKLINTNLEKENKKLNLETLEVMPEHKFEPFEKVLCRDYKDSVWDVDFFGFKVKNETETSFIYRCVGNIYKYCIPYKGNEHLLGTSKDPEEK